MRAEIRPGLDTVFLASRGADALAGCSMEHDTLKERAGAAFTEAKDDVLLRRGSKGAVDRETHV